ncbi:MAG: ADP compounds hydrolase NudE, partial [Coxiellaceae bacterium]|nr:ADP compounds hydrolase NudE [Coxiellaceae bacterium]
WAKGSVMVLPLLDDETVLLIREYGVGVDGYTLGFPKGAVHVDEDTLETANRELQEEVGYKASELKEVMEFATSPGYLTANMQLVLARGLTESKLEGDEPEPLEVVPWRLDQVDALLANPEFVEARSIAAMLWLEREWRAKRVK